MVVVVVVISMVAAGCGQKRADAGDQATDTIAPATPAASADTDTAMTQTTEIGDERSPNEGGVLTDSNAPEGTTTTVAAPDMSTTSTKPAPKKKPTKK